MWLHWLYVAGAAVAAAGVLWRSIAAPLIKALRSIDGRLESYNDMVDAVRDLTVTVSRWISETELRLARIETRLGLPPPTRAVRLPDRSPGT